jgi:hypothetical protein
MAWQDPLAEHPAQSPDLTVFTQAVPESVLITIPCSVAIIYSRLLSVKKTFFKMFY